MDRTDISNRLIHFTKGNTPEEAFDRLRKIMSDRVILGGSTFRKGNITCVCLSEAPSKSLPDGLRSYKGYAPYSSFGVMFDKKWVFSRGGRPVIYEPDDEYELLPESLRWRHVRYDPTAVPPIDFTWEREWRIPCAELPFGPDDATIVLPSLDWIEEFPETYQVDYDQQVGEDSLARDIRFDKELGEIFPWHLESLDPTEPGSI